MHIRKVDFKKDLQLVIGATLICFGNSIQIKPVSIAYLEKEKEEEEEEKEIGIIVYMFCDDRITGIFSLLRTVYCGDHKRRMQLVNYSSRLSIYTDDYHSVRATFHF